MGHSVALCGNRHWGDEAMSSKARILLIALLAGGCLTVAAVAWAAETLTVSVNFDPDRLGVPTNVAVEGKFHSSSGGLPSPITKFTAYLPAGLTIDTRGAGTCTASKLEASGPAGCPADSRAGFGGGVGLLELAHEIVRESYTLDFFFAGRQDGRLVLLAYVDGIAPASVEQVLVAREITAPKPYGIGFSVVVPPIATLPDASDASVESAFLTIGSANVAYYEQLHGKKTLVHVRGLVTPKSCPAGGFRLQATIGFADDTSLTVDPTVPCP
jgi:hypothetical protein